MSRKTKSDLSFVLKISLLFIILFASKLNKSMPDIVADKTLSSKQDTITFVSATSINLGF